MLKRRWVAAVGALTLGVLSACTGSGDDRSDPTVALVSANAPAASVPGPTATLASTQISTALFVRSPAIILTDAASVTEAAKQAGALGVPLLVVPDADTAPTANSATGPSETAPPEPGPPETGPPETAASDVGSSDGATTAAIGPPTTDQLSGEVVRLGATTALVFGAAAAQEAEALRLDAVTKASALPKVTKAAGSTTTLVLTAPPPVAGLDQAALTAVTATATAAGATVVSTASGDPRRDPAAIEAIAKAKPTRVIGVGGIGDPTLVATRVATAATGVQLPGGGQTAVPDKLYIALYGHPDAPVLGVLGEQSLDDAVTRAREHAEPYRSLVSATVVPTFEIIATVATGGPTDDNDYSRENDPEFLRPWIERAQAEGIYVILDLQPGRDDLLDQARMYEALLAYPNVGLAVDPEWKLGPEQRPLRQIGSVDVEELNRVGGWLAEFTRAQQLPQKLYVIHQFRKDMVDNRPALVTGYDELAVVIHVDGQGDQGSKQVTWNTIRADAPAGLSWGWKNFYDEDPSMLSPEETIAQVQPLPVMISYQ